MVVEKRTEPATPYTAQHTTYLRRHVDEQTRLQDACESVALSHVAQTKDKRNGPDLASALDHCHATHTHAHAHAHAHAHTRACTRALTRTPLPHTHACMRQRKKSPNNKHHATPTCLESTGAADSKLLGLRRGRVQRCSSSRSSSSSSSRSSSSRRPTERTTHTSVTIGSSSANPANPATGRVVHWPSHCERRARSSGADSLDNDAQHRWTVTGASQHHHTRKPGTQGDVQTHKLN